MGSRLESARRQGQQAAEIKKDGEISVLRSELGSRSRTLGSVQSCLHSLKEDMGRLHQQMDQHSATIHASHDSARCVVPFNNCTCMVKVATRTTECFDVLSL